MDPGSAATFLDDPAGALERLAEQAGVKFHHLMAARERTGTELARQKAELGELPLKERLSIVEFGSAARRERTSGSDDDWAVVLEGPLHAYDHDLAVTYTRCLEVLGKEDRRPGSQGIFGVPFSCYELTEHIGLDQDTNTNLTRRMLFLLESTALDGVEVHERCRSAVLDAYLGERVKTHRAPRFLLNDLVRYWRTIGVDFEGKHRGPGKEGDPKWVERNAKLRTARKLLFAGGLVPVLACAFYGDEAIPSFLARQFKAPPLDRLAAAFLAFDAIDEGVRALGAYDRWLHLRHDPEARGELERLRAETRDDSPLFNEIRELGTALDRGITSLLLDTGLAPQTRRYALL